MADSFFLWLGESCVLAVKVLLSYCSSLPLSELRRKGDLRLLLLNRGETPSPPGEVFPNNWDILLLPLSLLSLLLLLSL